MITKAVIPAAGFGTRFLPQTKAIPKEMLPIVDKPVIQYVVEELVDAGIKDIIMVTGFHKRTIEDHFDIPNFDLVENLKLGGAKKEPILKELEKTKLVKAKSNRFNMRSTGFPDFLAFKNLNKFGHFKDFRKEPPENLIVYEVIAVECKSNGTLSKEEEQKCEWYLKNKIFSKILIASKGEKRGEIVYR